MKKYTDQQLAEIATNWWREFFPHIGEDGERIPGNRAGCARLRRCATVLDTMAEPATIDLAIRLGMRPGRGFPKACILAATLSHVCEDVSGEKSTAYLAGPKINFKPETAEVSPSRMDSLMRAAEDDEILRSFRRLVLLLKGQVPVGDLAVSILRWGEYRKSIWWCEYWHLSDDALPPPSGQADAAP